jgi:hypothetical protein
VLKVISYYNIDRLSFKGFLKFLEMVKRDQNLVRHRCLISLSYENALMVQVRFRTEFTYFGTIGM